MDLFPVHESFKTRILVLMGGSRVIQEGGLALFICVLRRKGEAGIRLRRTNKKACGLGTSPTGALLEVKLNFKMTC